MKNIKKENGLRRFREILDPINDALIIHYSSESYFDLKESSPRINAIAIKHLHTGQTKLFSVHKEAEVRGISPEGIKEKYEVYEKDMLQKLKEYFSNHNNNYWVHWRMHNEHFGFEAIERRAEVLGISPPLITAPSDKFFCLGDFFVTYFGRKYSNDLKFNVTIERNSLSDSKFIKGKDEAEAWAQGRYYDVSVSTLKKVDIISDMIFLFSEGGLRYSDSRLAEIARTIKNHPIITILTTTAVLTSGVYYTLRIFNIISN